MELERCTSTVPFIYVTCFYFYYYIEELNINFQKLWFWNYSKCSLEWNSLKK
jgi:hypothetical protein